MRDWREGGIWGVSTLDRICVIAFPTTGGHSLTLVTREFQIWLPLVLRGG